MLFSMATNCNEGHAYERLLIENMLEIFEEQIFFNNYLLSIVASPGPLIVNI
ncbi:Uncharacterised protein [Legionella sainthelensi]|nr:Uncharacterised protein [Legionella sainthelensi]